MGEWVRAAHFTFLSRHVAGALWQPLRLIVSIPVRHGKSELCGHWMPIWYLLNRPRRGRILIATHNDDFATFFGRRIRDRLRETPRLGLQVKADASAAGSWQLTSGASVHTAGVGGSITGRGFDLIICDDVVKDFESAHSERQRDITWDWFRGTLSSRLQPGGSIVIIQSRWHEDDLVGRLLGSEYESERYDNIDLPAIATGPDVLGRVEGDALWPEVWPLEELAKRRKAVGSLVWSAQYQGAPSTPEGNLFKREWWQRLSPDQMPETDMSVRFWDLGYSDAPAADYTVGSLMHRAGERIIISDVKRFRATPGERDKRIKATAAADGEGVIIGLPNDQGQIAHFEEHVLQGHYIEEVKEIKDKLSRAVPFAARVEAKDVFLVDAPWNAAFINEAAEFPGSRHDDQVDSGSNAYSIIVDPRFAPLAFA